MSLHLLGTGPGRHASDALISRESNLASCALCETVLLKMLVEMERSHVYLHLLVSRGTAEFFFVAGA